MAAAKAVSLPLESYTNRELKQAFYEEILTRVRALSGVGSAGWISRLPLEGEEQVDAISVPGRPGNLQGPVANHRYMTPGYFASSRDGHVYLADKNNTAQYLILFRRAVSLEASE